MSWIFFATAGYFLNAVSVLGDKIILGKILPKPASYAFWQGILSLGVLALVPFGFSFVGTQEILISFLAGAFWVYGLTLFFKALLLADASKVLPIVLSLTPLVLFFSEKAILKNPFSIAELAAIFLLIAGGILLSFDLDGPENFDKNVFLLSLFTSLLFAISLFLMKILFLRENFVNVLVWSRLGLFLGGMSFLLFPKTRKQIFISSVSLKKPKASVALVINKLFGAAGAFAIFFAISRGTTSVVNALQGLQYAFLFILSALVSIIWPDLVKESFGRAAILQKIFGILLASTGLIFISFD